MDADPRADLEDRFAVARLEDAPQVVGRLVSPRYRERPAQEMRHGRGIPDAPVPGDQTGDDDDQNPPGSPRSMATNELEDGAQARPECRKA
jgi:hypothetical protein